MTVRTAGGGDGWCIVCGVRCLAGETLPRLVRTGAAGTRMLQAATQPSRHTTQRWRAGNMANVSRCDTKAS